MTETKLGTTGHTFKKHIHWFLPISVDAIQKDRETEESVKKKKASLNNNIILLSVAIIFRKESFINVKVL